MLLEEIFRPFMSIHSSKKSNKPTTFPKKGVWTHKSGGSKSGWSEVDNSAGEVGETEKVKAVKVSKAKNAAHTRATAPTGMETTYRNFIKGNSE